MPRKTRKEKILASQRKKEPPQTLQNEHIHVHIPQSVSTETQTVKTQKKVDTAVLSQSEQKIRSYFYADLKKSTVLVAGIIALEFFLYFASINHYLPK